MFAKQLVLIAAAVALAVTPAVALDKQTTHIKIHIVHGASNHKQVDNTANATWSHSGSAAEETEVGDDKEDDDEEDEEDEETTGSSSATGKEDAEVGDDEEEEESDDVETGENEAAVVVAATTAPKNETVAATAPASALCSGKDQSPMSVEGVEGIFCVTGQACVADIVGACPDKQTGLPLGAYCGKVQSGVLGCKPNTEETLKNAHKYQQRAKHLAKSLDAKYKPVVKKVTHKKH